EGTSSIPGVLDVPTNESDEDISCKSSDKEGDNNDDDDEGDDEDKEFIHPSLSTHDEEETRDEESFNPIPKTPKNTDDVGNGEQNLGTNVGREEGHDEEDEEDELDVNINLGKGTPTLVAPLPESAPTLTPSTITTVTTIHQAPTPPITALSTLLQDLPNFSLLFGFDHRLKTLEANFSEFMQTNQFVGASERLRDEAQAENKEFLKTIDENMQKIIKEQVKEQVKVQVSKVLRKIEQTVNEQLEAEVLTRSYISSKASYAVAADLSEMELKKILIKKMEGNKSIHRSNEQRNLYKALVQAYESDKIILDTYGNTVTLKRRRDDDADKDKEPSAESDRGSKRQTEGKEPESASTPNEKATRSAGKSTQGLVELEFFLEEVYKETTYQLDWVNPKGQQYLHNLLKHLPLISNSRGRRVIPFDHFINNDLEYLRRGASSHKYTTFVTKTKATDYVHIKWINDLVPRPMWIQEPVGYDKDALWGISHWGRKRQQFYSFAVNRESARDVYSKRRIIAVIELKIVEWHNYKHLDWITVCRNHDKLYKFKEGDFKRLRIQDIEDMLRLLVQGKLINLTVEERFAFNVSLRMFTRSIVIQRRVEDLQLGVESYQKKLNLTRLDTYRSDLKRKEAYIAYSNPRGFTYQNKDKQNMLMRIDELHKFNDGMLTDVRTALDDRLKGIRMKYLPQSIWRKSDKDRAAAMIHAIDKQLKTRRIMRSLERFVRGRLYEGDCRMLQRTI
nr:hypothetical protein [Tanacetum cinerariifolium]